MAGKLKQFWHSGWRIGRTCGALLIGFVSTGAALLSLYDSPTLKQLVENAMADPKAHAIAANLIADVHFSESMVGVWLKKHGFNDETKASIVSKLTRGRFAASCFFWPW